jgi:hypothetical protein
MQFNFPICNRVLNCCYFLGHYGLLLLLYPDAGRAGCAFLPLGLDEAETAAWWSRRSLADDTAGACCSRRGQVRLCEIFCNDATI